MYFRLKKIQEIIDIYEKACEKADEQFQSVYIEAVTLNNKPGTESCPHDPQSCH